MLMYLSVGTHYSVKRCKVTIFLPNNMLWNTLFFTHHRKKVILSMNLILFNAFCGFELAKWHYCDILSQQSSTPSLHIIIYIYVERGGRDKTNGIQDQQETMASHLPYASTLKYVIEISTFKRKPPTHYFHLQTEASVRTMCGNDIVHIVTNTCL